jgi:hypothetical protein
MSKTEQKKRQQAKEELISTHEEVNRLSRCHFELMEIDLAGKIDRDRALLCNETCST